MDENNVVNGTADRRGAAKGKARPMGPLAEALKRTFDLVASVCGLLVSLPFLILIGIAIKIESRGPAVFSQERVGRGGKHFTLYKFRSMRCDSESDGVPALYHEGDERLTKVGKFLREHHIDELPQLWNVMKGEMSFVGPRPERPFYVERIMEANPDYARLFSLRPGLFSYATLYNGYTDTMEKMLRRLELDLYYMKHRSWWLDCKILFLTFVAIIFGKKF